jgi:transcriptional regulator with XRE-family HTH domain
MERTLKPMDYRHDLFEWRRERTGETYDAIADRCELSKNTVYLIILGKTNPTASSINRISRALGLDPKFALDFKLRKNQFRRAVVEAAR